MLLNKPIRIAVAGDITHPDVREFIRGVGIYVRRHTGWEVRVAEPPLESVLMLGASATSQARDIAGVLADFDDPRITEAIQFIRKKGGAVTVLDVAQQTALGRATLDQQFKRCTGYTVQAEIEKARLERIRILLKNHELSLKAIAYEVGFRHASYLTAFFKKKTGTSPSAYRNATRTSMDYTRLG